MNLPLVLGCGLAGLAGGTALAVLATGVRAALLPVPVPAPPGPDGASPDPGSDVTGSAVTGGPAGSDLAGSGAAHAASGRVAAGVVTGGLFAVSAQHFGAVPVLAAYCVLFAGLVAVSLVDLRVGLVPRAMLYPMAALFGIALVSASAAGGDWRGLRDAAIGAALAFAVFFAVWFLYPRGLGFGDVRLAAVIGAGLGWLGLLHVYVGFLVGFVAGAAFGAVVMVGRGTGRKTRMPFAPALAVGAVVGVLWGTPVINAWLPGHG